jgi:hypothetical protein
MPDLTPTESSLDLENLGTNLLLAADDEFGDAFGDLERDREGLRGAFVVESDTQTKEGDTSNDLQDITESGSREVEDAVSEDIDMNSVDRSADEDAFDHENLEDNLCEAVSMEPADFSVLNAVPAESSLHLKELQNALPLDADTEYPKKSIPNSTASASKNSKEFKEGAASEQKEPDQLTLLIAAATIEDLTSRLNTILSKHYGHRVRYAESVPDTKYAVSWSVKIDDVLIPIAILPYRPYEYPEDTDITKRVASAVKHMHGCLRIAICNGTSLILFTFSDSRDPSRNVHGVKVNGGTSRAKLMTWLGHAIKEKRIKMLEALPNRTLETSTIDALGYEPPARGFDYYNPINTSQLNALPHGIGDVKVTYYATKIPGQVLCMDPTHLPQQDNLITAEAVCKVFEPLIICPVNPCLEMNYRKDIKCSNDILPNSTTWFERGTNRAKFYISILQYAAPGTIVPKDWGMLLPELSFTNGEGIVRSALPLKTEMDRLAEKYDCHCVGLFDYDNLVLVTREADCDEFTLGSMVLVDRGRVRDCLFRWMVVACDIHLKLGLG